jgi:endoglucanase
MPSVFAALAHLTGDAAWQRAAATSVALVRGLTGAGRRLPTDWARLEDGRLSPTGTPDGSAPAQYGLDAARVPLWFDTGCVPGAQRLAARSWTDVLSRDDRSSYLALTPGGTPLDHTTHPVPLLAGAAAAAAAGEHDASDALRACAARQAHQVPTYYGDAWLALGSALFDGSLDPCTDAE